MFHSKLTTVSTVCVSTMFGLVLGKQCWATTTNMFDEKPPCCPGVVSHNQIMMIITFPYESMPNRIDNQLKPPSGDLEMPAVSGGSLDQKNKKIT